MDESVSSDGCKLYARYRWAGGVGDCSLVQGDKFAKRNKRREACLAIRKKVDVCWFDPRVADHIGRVLSWCEMVSRPVYSTHQRELSEAMFDDAFYYAMKQKEIIKKWCIAKKISSWLYLCGNVVGYHEAIDLGDDIATLTNAGPYTRLSHG